MPSYENLVGFWKIWNSTFDRKVIRPLNVGSASEMTYIVSIGALNSTHSPLNVGEISDNKIIADNFATHFEKVCTPSSHVYDDLLRAYNERRLKYDEPLNGSKKSFLR